MSFNKMFGVGLAVSEGKWYFLTFYDAKIVVLSVKLLRFHGEFYSLMLSYWTLTRKSLHSHTRLCAGLKEPPSLSSLR